MATAELTQVETYLTTRQVGEQIGKSSKTVCRYVSQGVLKGAVRDIHSNQLLIPASEVERYKATFFVDARDERYIDSERIEAAHRGRDPQ